MKIVGMEGSSRGAPLDFGAAATSDGESVWNAVLRTRCREGEWDAYVEDGAASTVAGCPELPGGPCDKPYCLMRVREGTAACTAVAAACTTRPSWTDAGYTYFVFDSFEQLKEITLPLARPLYESAKDEDEVWAACTLDHRLVLERHGYSEASETDP